MSKKKTTTGGEQKPITPKEWNIVWRPVEELTPYQNNARINDQTVPYLMNSIKRFGFKNPIIVDKDGVIIAGHTRLKAALELGYTKLPCVCADDLSPEEVKAFRLVDNKVAELSSWDYEILDSEMLELKEQDFSLDDFGFADTGKDWDDLDDISGERNPPELDAHNKTISVTVSGDISDKKFDEIKEAVKAAVSKWKCCEVV